MANNTVIARAHEMALDQYEHGHRTIASLLTELAYTLAVQDSIIADTIPNGLETTNEATEQRLRAEAAEAGLRDLMEVTMKQLSPEQWKAIEPVVRDVRSLANPRAEAVEARIRAQDKTIAALEKRYADSQNSLGRLKEESGKRCCEASSERDAAFRNIVKQAQEIERLQERIRELGNSQSNGFLSLKANGAMIAELTETIASLQDVLEVVIPLIPVRPEYSGQIYRASATLAQTLAEGTQK